MNNTVIDDTLSYDGVLFDDLGVASQCLSRTDAPTPHLIADDVAFTIAHHASPTHALVGLTDEPDNHFDVGNDKSSTNDSEDKCEGDLLSETQSSDSSLQTRHISHEGSDTEEDIQPNECMVLVFNSGNFLLKVILNVIIVSCRRSEFNNRKRLVWKYIATLATPVQYYPISNAVFFKNCPKPWNQGPPQRLAHCY